MFGPNIKKMKAKGDVASLLVVAAGRSKRHQEAWEAIESLGPSADVPLVAALQGNYTSEAGGAAFLLGSLAEKGDADARAALLDYIKSPDADGETCCAVLGSLRGFEGDDVVDAFIAFLEGPCSLLTGVRNPRDLEAMANEPMKWMEMFTAGRSDRRYLQLEPALRTLARCANPKAAGVFRVALQWQEPTAKGLEEQLLRDGSYNHILASLRRSEEEIRTVAATGLGLVRDADSVPLLLAVLSDKDEDSDLMAAAARALGQIGDTSAVGTLVETFRVPTERSLEDGDNPKSVGYERVARVREAAARALAEIGTPEALAALELAASGGAFGERTAAREALGLPNQP